MLFCYYLLYGIILLLLHQIEDKFNHYQNSATVKFNLLKKILKA